MKNVYRFAVLVALAFGGLAVAGSYDVRSEIEAVYASWDKATMKMDLKALEAMLHPNFVQVTADGRRMNRDEVVAQFHEIAPMVKDVKSKIVIDKIDAFGDEAIVWNHFSVSGKMKQGKKWVPISMSARTAETLRKTSTGWKFVLSQEIPD